MFTPSERRKMENIRYYLKWHTPTDEDGMCYSCDEWARGEGSHTQDCKYAEALRLCRELLSEQE
ncbi:hypothetical protein LCGC14_1990650 [marine sediment metagenome]|uniref:Uncharacterized protein n=1 Tax=marine sediment metagenome TaxID=412755 RepID=A0A0F9FU98_9ZZZZ